MLAQSSAGRLYIRLYYTHAAEMTGLALFNWEVREKMTAALHAAAPAIKNSLQGGDLTLNAAQRQKIVDCVRLIKKASGPELREALSRLEQNMGDGAGSVLK